MTESESPMQELFDRRMYNILETIFMKVHPPDLVSCKLVNKEWHDFLKQHFWAIPRIRCQLMERKKNLIDENRRMLNYIRTYRSLPDLGKFRISCLATNWHWIVVGLTDGRVVVIDSITNDLKVLDPPSGHPYALVALNGRSAVVVHSELCLVFEDWVQQQAIQLKLKLPLTNLMRPPNPVITPKSKYLICQNDSDCFEIYTKQSSEYQLSFNIESSEPFEAFDANDDVIVAASLNGSLEIWSTQSGQLIKVMNVELGIGFELMPRMPRLCLGAGSVIYYKSITLVSIGKIHIVDWKTEKQETMSLAGDGGLVSIFELCLDEEGDLYTSSLEVNQAETIYRIGHLTKRITLLKQATTTVSCDVEVVKSVPPSAFSLSEMGTLVCATEEGITTFKYFH